MKKCIIIVIILVVVLTLGLWLFNRPKAAPEMPTSITEPEIDTSLWQVYENNLIGFSIRLPSLVAASSDAYPQSYGLTEVRDNIVKFVIPPSMVTGTNLSTDSYLGIERLPTATSCKAEAFFADPNVVSKSLTEGATTYSVVVGTDAAAGNRYEETIYALTGSQPCLAVRYFLHYGSIENYPSGTVTEFDKAALLKEFDAIRRSLVIQ